MIDSDVLVVGAGPAGSVAAALLARAGVRVRLVDRAVFPRFKLCGDTINPGTLARLRRLDLLPDEAGGLRVSGMTVTGHRARLGRRDDIHGRTTTITADYPDGLYGLAISRSRLDFMLLEQATGAGALFDPAVTVAGALVDSSGHAPVVTGARISSALPRDLRAPVTIAADGRRSRVAFGLGLTKHPAWPRRWAVGAYATGVADVPAYGEMHIRSGGYIGVAPMPEGPVNVCVVTAAPLGALRDPRTFVLDSLAADPLLRDRFHDARLVTPPVVLGPLAVESTGQQVDGLILAGDAAGFIDPMTGDGLRFAIEGAELAAAAALRALAHGWGGVHADLARARSRAFASKWLFNRALRTLVSSPAAVAAAALAAHAAPSIVRAIVTRAGDCGLARDVGPWADARVGPLPAR